MGVLKEFGFGSIQITVVDLLKPDVVLELGFEPNRIDIMTSISGVEFTEAYKKKRKSMFGRQPAFFISFQHLVRNKKATGRLKDMADVETLLKS